MSNECRLAYFVDEISQMTGLSTQKVRRMIKAGELPSIRAGKRILVPRAALELFLNSYKTVG